MYEIDRRNSPRATLAALGLKLQALELLAPLAGRSLDLKMRANEGRRKSALTNVIRHLRHQQPIT